ncbi:hypothetical protein [Rhizobium sp. IBUN]|uniref:hypothetical protein n=1 Tax=Rhizobium sp. IBUN TaxID=1042326 RepID=UPI0004249969|nr:hypothetical protein [Rhizobium sp. IBUN]
MNDMRAELGLWVGLIETILINRGVLNNQGQLATGVGISLPQDVEEILDGFIENPIELVGLLKISREARDGRPLSPAVLMAAHLMARRFFRHFRTGAGRVMRTILSAPKSNRECNYPRYDAITPIAAGRIAV